MLLWTSMTSLDALIEAAKIVETERDQKVSQALKDIGLFSTGVEEDDSLRRRPGGYFTLHKELTSLILSGRPWISYNPQWRAARLARAGTREIHNKLEKNRRAHMKECFEKLKTHIPNLESKKASNLGILIGASNYIQKLKEQDKKYEEELEKLTCSKIRLQQRMHVLTSDIKKQLLQQQLFAQVQKEKRTAIPVDASQSEQSNIDLIQEAREEEEDTGSPLLQSEGFNTNSSST